MSHTTMFGTKSVVWNTKEAGVVEFLVFQEKDTYVGVCLSFGIVEEGKDPSQVMANIKEAATLHLEAVVKSELPDDLLNRHAPKEYWDKYYEILEEVETKQVGFFVRSPYYQTQSVSFA